MPHAEQQSSASFASMCQKEASSHYLYWRFQSTDAIQALWWVFGAILEHFQFQHVIVRVSNNWDNSHIHIWRASGNYEQCFRATRWNSGKARRTQQSSKRIFILFNSGLHDINRRCATPKTERKLDFNTSCTQDYEESLWELLRLLDTFPATLKVFQSTTAGWPKYGNYGFAWPPSIPQLLPRDPTFVAHFNNAADRVLSKYNKKIAAAKTKAGGGSYRSIIPTMDAYWLTLARPDHRQVDKDNFIGKHLAHAGPEVYTFLVRKWTMLVLEATCGLGYYALQYESHPRRIIDKD